MLISQPAPRSLSAYLPSLDLSTSTISSRMPSKLEKMRAQLRVWTRVVIFLLGAASSSHAQTGDADSYTLRILPEANQIHVTATLRPTSSRLFMDPTQADHLPNGWATFVRDLRVTSGCITRTATTD